MTFEDALYDYLIAQEAIRDLVVERIYAVRLPQGTDLPAITYQKVGGEPTAHQDGASDAMMSRVQVTCWADLYGDVKRLAEAVRLALSGYRGEMGRDGDGVTVLSSIHSGDVDGFDAPGDGSDAGSYQVAIDFEIWHRVSVPE